MIELHRLSKEDILWSRYDECYQTAKLSGDAETMLNATDRMAYLLGVTFDFEVEEDEE